MVFTINDGGLSLCSANPYGLVGPLIRWVLVGLAMMALDLTKKTLAVLPWIQVEKIYSNPSCAVDSVNGWWTLDSLPADSEICDRYDQIWPSTHGVSRLDVSSRCMKVHQRHRSLVQKDTCPRGYQVANHESWFGQWSLQATAIVGRSIGQLKVSKIRNVCWI